MSLLPLEDSLRLDGLRSSVVEVCDIRESRGRIALNRPNVLMVDEDAMQEEVVREFAAGSRGAWSRMVSPKPVPAQASGAAATACEDALRGVEREFARTVNFAPSEALIRGSAARSGCARVIVVGAGVVGLSTALALAERGHRVTVVEATPPPGCADWRGYGCTYGGEDARMFSMTEYDNYNEKCDTLYADMGRIFERPLAEGGWLAMDPDDRTDEERAWNEMFRRVPPWLARGFTEEIYAVGREASAGWRALFARHPALREGVGYREGILRIYDDPTKLEAARTLQQSLGALERTLTPGEVAVRAPLFADACAAGTVFGALEVTGFTVQVHAFCRRLADLLEEKGVVIRWNARASRFERGDGGAIEGLRLGDEIVRADHYIVSPGAYGGELLDGFAGGSLIHGVLGAWLALPHVGGALDRSTKLKRTAELNEDVNVTVGTRSDGSPVLILGSGYGYVGRSAERLDPRQLELMYRELDRIAECYFPEAWAAAGAGPAYDKKYCVRPWTPTGLGVFEIQAATNGLAIVVGGHNTGGFAAAPAIAGSVDAALSGAVLDMHWQFEPRRLAAALPALNRLARGAGAAATRP
jgi:D-amino-acid dehydrogenase